MDKSLEQRQLAKVIPPPGSVHHFIQPDPVYSRFNLQGVDPKTVKKILSLERKRIKSAKEERWISAARDFGVEIVRETIRGASKITGEIAIAYGQIGRGIAENPDPVSQGVAIATVGVGSYVIYHTFNDWVSHKLLMLPESEWVLPDFLNPFDTNQSNPPSTDTNPPSGSPGTKVTANPGTNDSNGNPTVVDTGFTTSVGSANPYDVPAANSSVKIRTRGPFSSEVQARNWANFNVHGTRTISKGTDGLWYVSFPVL